MTNISAEIFSPPTPPSNLCYNEYFNHTLLVGKLGDEGEGWPHTLKAKKLDFSNTLYLGLDLKTFYSSLMYCSILYVIIVRRACFKENSSLHISSAEAGVW